jgi:hypothetical protein
MAAMRLSICLWELIPSRAREKGFRRVQANNVRVDVNAVVNLDLKLPVGAVDQSVEVSAAVMLETQGTNLGKTIPTQAINDLPLFISGGVRSPMAFIVLTPGELGGLASTNPRISGGLMSGQSEQLDGAESQSERRNDAALQAISVEPLQEFKVQAGAFSAEFGHTSNGVLNFVKSFEHRFGNGLFVLASYTFEKTLTNAADAENPFQSNGPAQNSYNLAAEKSVASTDTPQNLRISTVYDLPIGRSRTFLTRMPKPLDWAIGGWKVSAIQTYVSGLPLTIVAAQNMYGAAGVIPVSDGTTNLAGTITTRGSFAPGAGTTIPLINPAWNASPATAYSVPYLNPAAFVYPANGVYGNTPSRVPWLRGAKTINEDIAILKSFHMTEKRYAEFRASASNAPNRVLLATPDTNMTHPTFGKITQPQGNSPRSVQLGLKVYF